MASFREVGHTLKQVAQNSWRTFIRKRAVFPQVGQVDFGDFGGTEPISRSFGQERGGAIDRYYLESFLSDHSNAIRGTVLEISEDRYTRAFGGDAVTRNDILHYDGLDGTTASIVGDLTDIPQIPDNTYDCLIITQTLQYIYDLNKAVDEMHRILAPGGICLCTTSGITPISAYDQGRWGEHWRFTPDSLRRLFSDVFGAESVEVPCYGNVYSATAFLQGLGMEDVSKAKLDVTDPLYPTVLCVRAQKS